MLRKKDKSKTERKHAILVGDSDCCRVLSRLLFTVALSLNEDLVIGNKNTVESTS